MDKEFTVKAGPAVVVGQVSGGGGFDKEVAGEMGKSE